MNRFRNVETAESLRGLGLLGLLSAAEVMQLTSLADDPGLDACLAQAETLHVHVKVEDTGALPATDLAAAGATLDHGREGFVKYRLPGGLNAIFSHVPVSDDDLAEPASARRRRPFLDHIGVDMRSTEAASRSAFESVPGLAAARRWRTVSQGGAGGPVRCCHVEVLEKLWLFPSAPGARPIELAFGPLRQNESGYGCDLRPAAEPAAKACCAARADAESQA